MNTNPNAVGPIHPGEVLKEEFLDPYRLTANGFAQSIGVPANRITGIINGSRAITGETAILFAAAFGTSPEFWINLQARYNLEAARPHIAEDRIRKAGDLHRRLCMA